MSFDFCWILWKQWGILEKQEWIIHFVLALLNFPCQIMCLCHQRETPEISKNLLCEIFCIDHTNYCWHARHIGSGCGQQRESANQQALLWYLTNERTVSLYLTNERTGCQGPVSLYHTYSRATKVIFKLRVNLGLDLISSSTEPVSNKKERSIRASALLPALLLGNNQSEPRSQEPSPH